MRVRGIPRSDEPFIIIVVVARRCCFFTLLKMKAWKVVLRQTAWKKQYMVFLQDTISRK